MKERHGTPAITPGCRLFVPLHLLDRLRTKVVELLKDGTITPFPKYRRSTINTAQKTLGAAAVVAVEIEPKRQIFLDALAAAVPPIDTLTPEAARAVAH